MTIIKKISIILYALMVGSCATEPTELVVAEEDWVYEIRAINLVVKAPADLNTVRGRPHSMAIGIFQMSDPNTFVGLSATQLGAIELLQKGEVDDTIVNFQQINIRPGEQKKISINRAQTAKYIGVIAGYFQLNIKTDIKVFDIPLRALDRGIVEKALAFATLIEDESKAIPGKLSVFVDLGRTGTKQIISLEDSIVVQQQKNTIKATNQEQNQQDLWFDTLRQSQQEAPQSVQ